MNLEPIRALLELAKGVPAGPWYTVDSVWLPGPDVPTYVIAGHHDPHVGKPVVDAFLKDEYAEDESEEEAVSEADAIMAFCAQARNSIPALSQLLEAVEGMERLEKEWLAEAKFYKSDRDGSYPAYKACTDAIHRLLHPEDK